MKMVDKEEFEKNLGYTLDSILNVIAVSALATDLHVVFNLNNPCMCVCVCV